MSDKREDDTTRGEPGGNAPVAGTPVEATTGTDEATAGRTDPLGLVGTPPPDAPSRRPRPKLVSLLGEFFRMSRTTAILLGAFVLAGALYLLVREQPVVAFGPPAPPASSEPPAPVESSPPPSGTPTEATGTTGATPTTTPEVTGTEAPATATTDPDGAATTSPGAAGPRGTTGTTAPQQEQTQQPQQQAPREQPQQQSQQQSGQQSPEADATSVPDGGALEG